MEPENGRVVIESIVAVAWIVVGAMLIIRRKAQAERCVKVLRGARGSSPISVDSFERITLLAGMALVAGGAVQLMAA